MRPECDRNVTLGRSADRLQRGAGRRRPGGRLLRPLRHLLRQRGRGGAADRRRRRRHRRPGRRGGATPARQVRSFLESFPTPAPPVESFHYHRGVRDAVLLTLGRRGVLLLRRRDAHRPVFVDAPRVNAVDTTVRRFVFCP